MRKIHNVEEKDQNYQEKKKSEDATVNSLELEEKKN